MNGILPEGRPVGVFLMLAAVFLLGAATRFTGIDWDGYSGLNPDERHMIFMMSGALAKLEGRTIGDVVAGWFATGLSPLDARADSFYVYGDLPHAIGTLTAWALGAEGWADRLETGRILSAAFDSFTILFVFAIGLAARLPIWAAVAAAGLYAAAPLAIQHAHFYVVDGMGTFFGALALWAALALARRPTFAGAALSGVAVAAAAACKLSFGMLAILPAFAVLLAVTGEGGGWRRAVLRFIALGLASGGAFLVAFRLFNPSVFTGPGILDVVLSERFLSQLDELSNMARDPGGMPPGWQWTLPDIHIRAFADLALWCFGPAITALFLIGAIIAPRRRQTALVLTGALTVLVSLLVLDIPAVRYALPAAPAIAVLGGLGGAWLARGGIVGLGVLALLLVVAAGWGEATARIYATEHPRIAASRWIWREVPPPAIIANETPWDDALPVTLLVGPQRLMKMAFATDAYTGLSLDLTDGDSPQKTAKIVDALSRADLLVISSGRQWRVMPHMAGRFPATARYYEALFDGRLCYGEVMRFDKPFTVFGFLELDDSGAQEIWRVYDRPDVRLYRRLPCFDAAKARAIIDGAP